MKKSDTISELTTALALAQGEFKAVKKSGRHLHMNKNYSTLDDVIAAVRAPMSAHGLSFIQPLTGNGDGFMLETFILHSTGEWISCSSNIPTWSANKAVNELQKFGGALTYMRRYMLTSLLGVTTEEDTDGNGSEKKPAAKKQTGDEKAKQATTQPAQSTRKPDRPTGPQPPKAWGNIAPPETWTDLWGDKMWELLGYSAQRHAENTIKQTYPDFGKPGCEATPAGVWTVLVEHKESKLAEDIDELYPTAADPKEVA